MNELLQKLDLKDYIKDFKSHFARDKDIYLQGDSKMHYNRILELSDINYTPPSKTPELSHTIAHLSKQGVLHIAQCYEIIKICKYFIYLKKLKFINLLRVWLDKIIIPNNILELFKYFDDKGEFCDELDERLINIKNAINIKNIQIQENFKNLLHSNDLKNYLIDTQIHFIANTECLLLKPGHKTNSKIIARSNNGGYYTIPNNIEKLKNEIEELKSKKEDLYYEYATLFSNVFHKELLFVKFIDRAFDLFDHYSARVSFAKQKDFEFILIDQSKDIILKDFVHPALKNAKSIDIDFSKKILLVTGVNAGGKSMLLKSILSAAFLARHLLPMHINAFHSKIGSFKKIKAIIEDPQNVNNDLSTFAGRMKEFAMLLEQKDVLIGIDEIELGTDFEESSSLYNILIQNLIAKNNKIIITTHHKILASKLAKNDEVKLLAALFDEELLRPRYEFMPDIIGKSYAFESAFRYGINLNIINEAKKDYGQNKQNLEELISKTIKLELELRSKLSQIDIKEAQISKLLKELKDQKSKNNEELLKTISKLELDYHQVITIAKNSLKLDPKTRQKAITKANEIKKAIIPPKISQNENDLKIGDFVKYNSIKGKIIKIIKNQALIQSKDLKLRIDLNLLSPTSPPPKIKDNITFTKANLSPSIDLHGLYSDEAIEKLDKFISDALIAGFDEVIIYHGIGTGKLAYAVNNFLKTHKSIKDFTDAPANKGGFGAKLVRL